MNKIHLAEMFKFNISHITGWRRLAVYLTALVFFLTCVLVAILVISLYAIHGGVISIKNDTVLWEAECDSTEKANLWLHLAINIISTAILASSNFFMQVLVAPTRKEVDRAHQNGYWVEIGVQSLRNFFFLPRHKNLLWFLFSTTSVPLHLIFNGCILESRASNAFWVLITSEEFLKGAPWSIIDFDKRGWDDENAYLATVSQIQKDVKSGGIARWETISWSECMERYNSPDKIIYEHRHVIMVVKPTIPGTKGCSKKYRDGEERLSSLCRSKTFIHVDSTASANLTEVPWLASWEADSYIFDYSVRPNPRSGRPPKVWLQEGPWDTGMDPEAGIDYCLSEKSRASCGLVISNRLLFIVCVMCSFKCILCVVTFFRVFRRNDEPLLTPGDAVASFIARPGEDTRNMCNLNTRDFSMYDTSWWDGPYSGYSKLDRSKPWILQNGRVGEGITRTVWCLSYLPIITSLILAASLFAEAVKNQPM
jgi:hypothetical protein